jgi:CRISPR-associated protein Cmx8
MAISKKEKSKAIISKKESHKSSSAKNIESKDDDIKEIILDYKLHELPSSQHKAGLAGIVLMVRWLKRNPHKVNGILEELECTNKSYKLRIDKEGMKSLFDETYSASWEEVGSNTIYKKKDKKTGEEIVKEPIRVDDDIITDKKTGKEKIKKIYIYPKVIPSGSFLLDLDDSDDKIWVKLFRSFVWDILRIKPLTHKQYELRADYAKTDFDSEINDQDDDEEDSGLDFEIAWKAVIGFGNNKKTTQKLKGYNFLGAESKHSDGNGFFDSEKNFLLLNFWLFISQIYVPQKLKYDNSLKKFTSEDNGFIVTIPEIIDLSNFCLDFSHFMKARDKKGIGFKPPRPRGSRISIMEEGGWEFFERVKISLGKIEGQKYSDMINGIDIFHIVKNDKNSNNKAIFRIRPDDITLKEYEAFKNDQYYDPVFRKQVLTNISKHEVWYTDFDKLFQISSYEYFLGSGSDFPGNVDRKFRKEFEITQKEKKQMKDTTEVEEDKAVSPENAKSPEQIIYSMVWTYISMKLDSKYGLKKESAKSAEYIEKKEKLAKETFLAIRSRTGEDFISYFSSTICSVGQYMNEERYLTLTKALFDDTEKVRTLVMLAISAVSYTFQKKEN